MPDLAADPGYLESLAKKQDQASGEIKAATNGLKDSVAKLWFDHGFVSGECITALQGAEKARKRAGDNVQKVSDGLAERLRAGADAYGTTDKEAGGSIDQQVLPG